MSHDPFVAFKAAQREGWALFAPIAPFTTPAAASLVDFAGIAPGQRVLDVACGTGVVALTAAQRGARATGLDLSPVLLADAARNAAVMEVEVEFSEGDVESLPYADASFDVVLSQFGHMFAPRPEVALSEMLRVLRPGGRIAFSTWPPELAIGRLFATVGRYAPAPAGAAPSWDWGNVEIVRQRFGEAVRELEFHRDEMSIPALSARHYRANMERTAAPLIKVVQMLAEQPEQLAQLRSELEAVIAPYLVGNRVRQSFLMSRAIKR